jgi:hypothetical protein
MAKQIDEHSFSIEMTSEHCVRRMSLLDRENGQVFFEGFLGELKNVSMVEDLMLEITGVNGILRVDISKEEIEKFLGTHKATTIVGEQLE